MTSSLMLSGTEEEEGPATTAMHRIKSVPKVKSGNVRRLEKKGHAEESRPRKSQTHAVISFADFRIRSFVRKRFFSTFSHDLKAGRLLVLTPDVFLRLAFLGDPEDRPRQRTPLAVRLVGGRVVRVEAPSFLLQVPQNQLPQGLNCGETETVKTQSGDSCGVPGCPFLSPSCNAASDTLAGLVPDCSAGTLEGGWTSWVEWASMESD